MSKRPRPLTVSDLQRITSEAASYSSTVYVRVPMDMPGVAEAGDLVHCAAEIDGDGDLVISAFGSSAYDPLPMRPWPLDAPTDWEEA